MRTTRREVLAGLGALPVVVGCKGADAPVHHGPKSAPDRPPEPADWEAPGELDEQAFAWSVQAGDALPDGIVLGVRTTEPELALVVVGATDDGWEEVDARSGLASVDGEVQVVVDGLEPDRAHRYAFTTPDGSRRSRPGRFRTALAEDGYRKVVFGATSCLGDADPTWPSLGFVAADQLDFLLLLGDTVYADGAVKADEYRDFWKAAFAVPSLADSLASTSVMAVWDDHEVANDWVVGDGSRLHTGVTETQVTGARALFQECLPQRTTADGPLYRTLRWGTVAELIALDLRGERAEGQILSEDQLAWAIDRVKTSPCWLKLVLVSVHITDHTALMSTIAADDRWQGYPDQRDRMIAAAAETPGVLFVTGDMHYGGIQRVSAEGQPGDGLYEIAAGPSGSEPLGIEEIAQVLGAMPPQYEDVVEGWSWAWFELDPGLGEVRIQLIGDDGQPLVDRVLSFPSAG